MSSTSIFLGLLVYCAGTPTSAIKIEKRFVFDEASGRCLNVDKIEGLNPLIAKDLFQGITPQDRNKRWPARDAQCTDFSNVRFTDFLGSNYNTLVHWDFRGSKFTGAKLLFSFIDGGLFKGSSVDQITVGYGRITASDIVFDKGDMPMPVEN